MAKGAVNKSQMIRDALKTHPRKSPSQIAEVLKEQGLSVTGQYVSTIKSNWKKSRRRNARRDMTMRGTARRTRRRKSARAGSVAGIPAALEFIRAAGGLEHAKSILQTIEEISTAVR
jgi:hypothetical protein